MNARREHLLLYEPRTEGHHLGWLRFITEDLLASGWQLTLAVDGRAEQQEKIRGHLEGLMPEVSLLDFRAVAAGPRAGQSVATVARCLEKSGAAKVFLCALDEIASDLWRRASFGWLPPAELRGRMGGIYHRPRFLEAPKWSPGRWLKHAGFKRLLRGGWLRPLMFVDEYLARDVQKKFPSAPVFFLCDPCPPASVETAEAARRQFRIPLDKRVFLFYGGGYRRKGLHLAVEAMRQLRPEAPAFLLCVGQLKPDAETAGALEQLIREKRALFIDRYVSTAEEELSFAASDAVLLPYIHHFGTSGVLSRAMSAGRMVIVSDEELLGRLTRDHGLGLLFPSGDAAALREKIREATIMPSARQAQYTAAAKKYAATYSRAAYRESLWNALGGIRANP